MKNFGDFKLKVWRLFTFPGSLSVAVAFNWCSGSSLLDLSTVKKKIEKKKPKKTFEGSRN